MDAKQFSGNYISALTKIREADQEKRNVTLTYPEVRALHFGIASLVEHKRRTSNGKAQDHIPHGS